MLIIRASIAVLGAACCSHMLGPRGVCVAWQWQAWPSPPFSGLTSSGPRLLLQADDYIHANEVILTFGMSETTSLFLQEAARKRDFQVGSNILPVAWQHRPAHLVFPCMAGICRSN